MDNVHHLKQMHPFCISEQKRNAIGVSPIAIIYISFILANVPGKAKDLWYSDMEQHFFKWGKPRNLQQID